MTQQAQGAKQHAQNDRMLRGELVMEACDYTNCSGVAIQIDFKLRYSSHILCIRYTAFVTTLLCTASRHGGFSFVPHKLSMLQWNCNSHLEHMQYVL